MRLPCAASRAFRSLQTPTAFLRNGLRRSLHNQTQQFTAAVVGGGITGLTAAYRLSKDPLCSKVTIYEKEKRLGGWLESETIEVDGGKVVFEYGPRTLRVGTLSCGPLLDLLLDLNLEDQILLTPKSAPASKNRYIYYPDRLVQMPSFRDGPFQLAQKVSGEPLFDTLITSLFKEAFMSPPKGKPQDESIMDFVSRRFSPTIANNLVSSIWHGILAGNIDRLSAEALMGRFRALEDNHGSIIGSLFALERQGKQVVGVDDLLARNVIAETKSTSYLGALGGLTEDSSTLTLKNGVGQLVDTLVEALRSSPKVEILTDQTLFQIKQNPKTLDLTIENAPQPDGRVHNRAIVTCSPVDLVIQSSSKNEVKNETARPLSGAAFSFEAVTVMVVNLYYPNPDLIPVKGFGYLIPRSIPYEQNPERALGVIFASDSSVGQDTAPGTKLTVMLGGHYWDGWKCEDYPDSETAVAMARSLLERHLGVTDTPTVTRTRLQKDAIPQPTVGHFDRMGKLSQVVREQYNNRVALAGAWYAMGNTGVVDSIRQAYLATFYGIKPRQPGSGKLLPWLPESESWELEGGVPTSPIREIIIYKDELKDREDD